MCVFCVLFLLCGWVDVWRQTHTVLYYFIILCTNNNHAGVQEWWIKNNGKTARPKLKTRQSTSKYWSREWKGKGKGSRRSWSRRHFQSHSKFPLLVLESLPVWFKCQMTYSTESQTYWIKHNKKLVFLHNSIGDPTEWPGPIQSNSFSRIIHNRQLNSLLNRKPACHQSPQWNI